MIIYLGWTKPWIETKFNRIDLVDECFLLAINYCYMHFTPYGWAQDQRYVTGIIFIVLIVLHILYHLVMMLYETFLAVHLHYRAYMIKKKLWMPVLPAKEITHVE